MKNTELFPKIIPNWIGSQEKLSCSGETIAKYSPDTGDKIASLTRSNQEDVDLAIEELNSSKDQWSRIPPVQRGYVLHKICNLLEENQETMAEIVAIETGKSKSEALGETQGAISLGRFFAGEGQRLYGKTTTSGQENKYAMTIRQPCGIAGLIIAANTPIANVAWKVFPALVCGNVAILKAPEDTPAVAWYFAKLAYKAGLPDGTITVIQGYGEECGEPIVRNKNVDVVSFTGSTRVGRLIAEICGKRLAKVSLELGGKNPFIVCDDADLDNAANWACLSAFSNAGQRCAAGSRIIVFESVYDEFKNIMIDKTERLSLGPSNDDDLGPVINERQLDSMLNAIKKASSEGSKLIIGGNRINSGKKKNGYYMSPTIIEDIKNDQEITKRELFGPIAQLYKAKGFDDAITIANDSPYGLTACIHTNSFDRAYHFTQVINCGVAVVNAGTYGSEPHMPFGGTKASGNGTREPGTEALDVYSELKDVYFNVNRDKV